MFFTWLMATLSDDLSILLHNICMSTSVGTVSIQYGLITVRCEEKTSKSWRMKFIRKFKFEKSQCVASLRSAARTAFVSICCARESK